MLDIHGNSGEPWRPCGLSHSHFSFAPRIRGAPMLTFMGFMTIAVVLVLLLSNRVGAVVALIGVPVIAAFLLGFGPSEVAGFVGEGINGVASTTAMFVFAILYFGVMRGAGRFDTIGRCGVRCDGNRPALIARASVRR